MQTSKDFFTYFSWYGWRIVKTAVQRFFEWRIRWTEWGYACGAAQMNVFVITSSIVITMEFPEEGARTQTDGSGKVVEMILQN